MEKAARLVALALAFGCSAGAAPPPGGENSVLMPLAAKSLLLDLAAAGTRLVTVGERGHVLLSDDQGGTWRQVVVPTTTLLTGVAFADAKLGLAVGHDSTILRTTDGGEKWTVVHSDVEADAPLFDVFFVDASRAFAVGAYGSFLESKDGGTSWEPRPITEADAHYHHLARAADGAIYLAAEGGLLLRSDDGGDTWRELAVPYEGSLFGTLPLAGENVLLFGLRGHALLSADGGRNWTPLETGVDTMLTGATRLQDGRLVMVGLAGVVMVSADEGRTFTPHQQGDRMGLQAVLATPDGGVVVCGESGVHKLAPAALAAAPRAEGTR